MSEEKTLLEILAGVIRQMVSDDEPSDEIAREVLAAVHDHFGKMIERKEPAHV